MKTHFAPPERAERRKFKNQISLLASSPLMNSLLKAAEGLLIVINENRQVVAMNHNFMHHLGIEDPEATLGLRLGEILNCVHSSELEGGCGTTFHCATCGAVIAMMAAIEKDQTCEKICALQHFENGSVTEKCLRVRARPIETDGNRWVMFFARDITKEQLLNNLEHTFFHDINNHLTSLVGSGRLLEMDNPGDDTVEFLNRSIDRLQNEIKIQKEFFSGKSSDFNPSIKLVSLLDIRQDIATVLKGNELLNSRFFEQSWPEQDVHIQTDMMLVTRILVNMILNALEAEGEQGKVLLQTVVDKRSVCWHVWNSGHIPERIGARVFQKYFSTKQGSGRGLGTYAMKLFGESFLNGRVSYTSSPDSGTTFTFIHPL